MKIKIYRNNDPRDSQSYDIPYTVITDSFLDEELDVCSIEIKHVKDNSPFPRFCVASLHKNESDEKPKYFLVASDSVLTNVATGWSDHTVQLIEPTKWLERFMVGNKCVTQPLYTDYLDAQLEVKPILGDDYNGPLFANSISLLGYLTPINPQTKNIPVYGIAVFAVPEGVTHCLFECAVIKDGEKIKEYKKDYEGNGQSSNLEIDRLKYEDIGTGSIAIEYKISWPTGNGANYHLEERRLRYEFVSMLPADAKILSLKDAAMSMICAAEILTSNGGTPAPRFKLNESIAQELRAIKSPEISVTNATLREALDEIGKVIDSITCLDVVKNGDHFDFEVNFEKYCKDSVADVSELGNPCQIFKKALCDDYCTALDATVDNLVQYDKGGSIFDPSAAAWRTVRSEDASYRVTEDNAVIYTAFPIERIDSLMCKIGEKEADLTEYLWESSEYAALSSYSMAYPYTKAFALCYTLGQKSITALNFTVPNAAHEIFETPALVNIINREFGTNYSNTEPLDFTDILFRVKYVPTGSARVIMRKPDSFGMHESVLPYNQSSAKLDATAFGRGMFGTVIRMGNVETLYTYIAPVDAAVPEKGERFGEDGYIAEIREEYALEHKKVTLTVVEGFNRISQFVGVDKEHRIFEISERTTLDRHIVYEDKCLISTKAHENLKASLVKGHFLGYIKKAFSDNASESDNGVVVTTRGYSKNDELTPCMLPCVTYALGNSLVFFVSFEDNYGAGRRIDSKDNENFYDTETDVRYTDEFGRVDTLVFSIHKVVTFFDDEKVVAKTLPKRPNIEGTVDIVSTGDENRLYIDKDTREAIRTLAYQISFLGDDGIKVSPGVASSFNFFNTGSDKCFAIVLLGEGDRVSNTTQWVEQVGSVGDARTEVKTEASIEGDKVVITFTAPCAAYGWAAVNWYDTRSGEEHDQYKRFLFGKNERIEAGESRTIYFNFYH